MKSVEDEPRDSVQPQSKDGSEASEVGSPSNYRVIAIVNAKCTGIEDS